MADGRTARFDCCSTGRLDDFKLSAFLRLLRSGTSNDPVGQLAAFRDLGALPADTDLDAVARDLGLDTPEVFDPPKVDGDVLVAEIQLIIKAPLGYGAKNHKELMLLPKNLIFRDSAYATLAPAPTLPSEINHTTN